MQKQDIAQAIYQKTQQLPVEDLEEVLQFVEFVQFRHRKKTKSSSWQQDFLAISQWDINA
ncbi:MAG: hypothetical protein PHH59_15985 [Methylovulum sp.]|uniref:hypothetical protein n=1 Tax=Methylovulum sp. TaxID=1916980 RepID=UPI00261EEC47|nr:hypothetical protein [Methylovulum sp.]MDD2725507.1 hypothetical protein [Methylovulum sp.]MDD5126103.1 hypothetical protein [Methylovulum sp.]